MALAPLLAGRALWLGISAAVVLTEFAEMGLIAGLHTHLVHWDALSYLAIARQGYPATLDYHDAFLPGFPLLIRSATFVLRDDVIASWIVNLVAEGVALFYVVRLVAAERDRGAATFSAWLLALFPTAVFLIAPFTEAPFIAAAAASLFYARQGRSGAAAVSAAFAVLFRLTGVALLPALLVEHLARNGRRRARALLWLLLIPLPLVGYCAYMQLRTGDALALFDANGLPSFGHAVAAPWDGLATTWNTMSTTIDGETRSIFAREIAFGLLGLVASVAMWASPRIPRSFALYCTLAWLLTASLSFWRSQPRYVLALFPALLLAADATVRSRATRAVVLTASAALMCAGTWIYMQGRWLG
ncbi:MAG: hypothetical protein ABR498_06135 [Candidatus Dormibacteria bacterium]